MIIDGHAHACGDFLKPNEIIKRLDAQKVAKVVLVPGEWGSKKNYALPEMALLFPSHNVVKITNKLTKMVMKITGAIQQIPRGNDFVYELCQQTHGRVLQFVWITQGIENPLHYLDEKFKDWSFKGIKMHQCWENFAIDSKFFKDIAAWAEEKELPLFIHLYGDKDVMEIMEYKRNHPKLRLIIAHLFGLELFMFQKFKCKNLYFDTSTLQLTSTKRLMKALNYIGAEHITLGSDTPYGRDNLRKNIERIQGLPISKEEKELILGENMKTLLKL